VLSGILRALGLLSNGDVCIRFSDMKTFDPAHFTDLRKAERTFFWFAVRRKWILDVLRKNAAAGSKVLEIGCGTGNVISYLSQNGYVGTGCELHNEAICQSWPGCTIIQGNATELPFQNAAFDVVALLDVLEHFENETPVISEALRVLAPNGFLLLTVPAHPELWSYHDNAACHKRRYTKKSLATLFESNTLRLISLDYMFMSLYWPMKLLRSDNADTKNPFTINRTLNFMLKIVFNMERKLSAIFPLPIGTSLIAVVRKIV